LGVVAAFGARRLWRGARISTVFLGAYVAIVIAWPFTPSRFIWGIWPLFILLPVLGAIELRTWVPKFPALRIARVALLAGFAATLTGYFVYNFRGYRGHWWSSIARQKAAMLRPMVLWTRERTAPGQVIASSAEPLVYLYGERSAVPAATFTV